MEIAGTNQGQTKDNASANCSAVVTKRCLEKVLPDAWLLRRLSGLTRRAPHRSPRSAKSRRGPEKQAPGAASGRRCCQRCPSRSDPPVIDAAGTTLGRMASRFDAQTVQAVPQSQGQEDALTGPGTGLSLHMSTVAGSRPFSSDACGVGTVMPRSAGRGLRLRVWRATRAACGAATSTVWSGLVGWWCRSSGGPFGAGGRRRPWTVGGRPNPGQS